MMEHMDIDQVVDIPDTPDRSATQNINAGDCVGKESKFALTGCLRNPDFVDEGCLNQPRTRSRLVSENGRNRRLHVHPLRNTSNVNKIEHCSNSIALSPSEKPHASRNASLFRRPVIDKNTKHETRNSQHMDKGKLMCSKFPSKSSTLREDNDLSEQNGLESIFEMASSRAKSKELPHKEIREGQNVANGGSSLHWPPNFPKTSTISGKGKEKIGDNTINGSASATGLKKVIDLSDGSPHDREKQMSTYRHSLVSPRFNGQKKLVRNGCISPHNIEVRAKQLAECSQNCFEDAEQDHSRGVASSGSCMTNISDIVAEGNSSDRSKGIMIYPSMLKERNPKINQLSGSSAAINEVNGNGQASGVASECFEGLGGWRSTHSRPKKVDQPICNATGSHLRRNGDIGCSEIKQQSRDNWSRGNYRTRDLTSSQTASRLVSEPIQVSEPHRVADTLTKRQKKHESTSRNQTESSRTVCDDSEIIFLGSSGESSIARSSRSQSHQHQGILDIDELSPEMRHSDSQVIGCSDNDDSDVRARQLEADEMLARELQEQLYHELPVFGDGEIDEHIALMLQQEEDAFPFSNHHVSHPRTTSMHSYRQPQLRLLQNSSNRRATRARVHTSNGVTQLRSRFVNRSRAAPSRARNFQFPLDMDLDMRIDMLEALEAAVGDLTDRGTARHISQLQRDFNENDYEMLLALDDNNNQNGASDNQINSLPLSTVQTENLEESCAICLDAPTIGETIRHLPCLHKFHKACIDPWLSRRPSCPVCKSSIT
ncbi:uncharacterized protein LOC116107768 [Pistacia vera]|uniref:uncharacterized protein LOC116107768 n=1 Tax=Pistacia vera TaxID=55513 RepID=UPI00126397D1|nr:uncharacterized protein LOC116107768 [Pistacia vera]